MPYCLKNYDPYSLPGRGTPGTPRQSSFSAPCRIADHRGENEWHHKVEDKRMVLEWDDANSRYLILSGM